jgi:cytochrome c oxidase assembly protein subunit 15
MTSRLGLATTLLMFCLIVIGSVVRTTGSGLACPDWPLCGGHLVPPFEFHVMIEWTHRLVALLVSLALFATLAWIVSHPEVRARLGGIAAIAIGLLVTQIVLGALTVWKLLSPAIVGSHLGVALLLFCTVLALTRIARAEASEARPAPAPASPGAPGTLGIGLTAVAAYGQCILGGIVSANGAGNACPDWPACNGRLFPALEGPVGLQMLHRYGAYLVVALVVLLAIRGRRAADARLGRDTATALALVLLQAGLGIWNVLVGVTPWLSALHLATAVAILAVLLVATLRSAESRARAPRLVPVEAR